MRTIDDLKLKDRLRTLLWGFPLTGSFMTSRYLAKNLGTEIELIKGRLQNHNTHRSIIHFSVNKAATQYVRDLLVRCAAENGMMSVGLAEYAFHTNFPYLDDLTAGEMEKYQYLFKPSGYLYTVFGGMIEGIEEFDKYLSVLMVRDPRDVIVSEYYSYAYSHAEPSQFGNKYPGFMEKRRKARQVSIAEYGQTECERVSRHYQRYIDLLLNSNSNVLVTKYEEMTSDWDSWLKRLLDFCQLEIGDELLQSLSKESKRLRPRQENVHQHIRKGMPGDYEAKLDRPTIEILNSKFSRVLKRFNYDS